MRHKLIYKVAIFFVVPLFSIVLLSCTDEFDIAMESQSKAFTPVGDPVQVHLNISVKDYEKDATRAEEPTEYDVPDTEEEKHIDDIWILEYDASSKALVGIPTRIHISDQDELEDLEVTLYDNDGKSVVVYAVANSGSGVEADSEEWISGDESAGWDGFMTLDELEAHAIPTPHPQRMTWDNETQTYVLFEDDASIIGSVSIPMAGYKDNVVVSDDMGLTIYVERMYAKLLLMVDLSEFEESSYQSVWLNMLSIGNIPEYCRVTTLWDGDTSDSAQMGNYPQDYNWISRRFFDSEGMEYVSNDDDESVYPYIIYIPENIQGENSTSDATNKGDNAPEGRYSGSQTDALSAEAYIYIRDSYGVLMGPYTYTAYPGGNETTNFNVRRNCIYRVKMQIGSISFQAVPSANCIVCLSGETTAFYPYCREETGGGYNFTDYLNAYDETDEESEDSKKIDHVEIIWQSTDANEGSGTGYIGDNSNGDYVWIDDVGEGDDDAKDEYSRRILVSIPEGRTGNALIGAYNKAGVIIWSWHIWSRERENDPTTVNTKLYYTYEWDDYGIYGKDSGRPRVAGYTIMNCNLGAIADDPSGDVSYARNVYHTFGTLYQWGRKDPFPPAMPTGNQQNTTIDNGEYNSTNVYSYYDNSDNEVSISGDYDTSALFYSVPGTERVEVGQAILNSIHNPTAFYASTNAVNQASYDYTGYDSAETALTSNYSSPQDGNWLLDSESEHYNRLWGGLDPEQDIDLITKSYNTGLTCLLGDVHLYDDYGEKSIFDPCPYGWRVSPPDLWLGFTDTGLNPGGTFSTEHFNYDTNYRATGSCGVTLYLTGWLEGESTFFPSQGVRAPDGAIMRMGACGNYNNATADAGDRVNILHTHYDYSGTTHFNIFEVTHLPYYVKSSANSVRCVRETR